MARQCPQCGAPFHGRSDKRFCSDGCRSDFHNERRRAQEKELRSVNRILSANWRLLMRLLRDGQRDIPAGELAARDFNFEIFTACRRHFPGRRTYWCYNCSYTVDRTGIVHIRHSKWRNNVYF